MKKNWILVLILLLASILRLWNLGNIPPHLTPDEASLGYNAYSILKTGRDEYGELFPLIFKSFGDYKPGLYVYLTVPFVAILGLTEVAVRLPSALAGVLLVYLIYLVTSKLFKSKKIGLASSMLLALNPWAIAFSRGAWEANISLALTLLGVYFFLKSLKVNKYLALSAFIFGLTLLTYQGAKLSSLIVVAILLVVYFSKLIKFPKKILLSSVLIGFMISLPIILGLFQGKAERLKVFSVFSYPRPQEYLQGQLDQGEESVGDASYYVYHSESLNFKRGIMGRWFNHFSTRFLFFEGDWANPRHTAPHTGVLIFADIVLIIGGFIALTKKEAKKEIIFVWVWLLLAPLPAALSRDQIQAVRSLNMVIPLTLLLAVGLSFILSKKKIITTGFIFFYLVNYVYFLDSYFVHTVSHNSNLWHYGYKQVVEILSPIQAKYSKVKVQQSFSQPYIYFLFFQKKDPREYQKQANLIKETVDVGLIERLDNIEFSEINWPIYDETNTLLVMDSIKITEKNINNDPKLNLISEIKYLNGRDTAFWIVEVK